MEDKKTKTKNKLEKPQKSDDPLMCKHLVTAGKKKLNFNRNLQQARLRDGQPSVVMSWR